MTFRKMVGWPMAAVAMLRAAVGDYRFRSQMLAQYPGLHLGKSVEIRSPGRLKMGKNAILETGVVLHCGGFDWSEDAGGITLGDDCYIGPNSTLFGSGGIVAGNNFSVGPGVVIAAQQLTQYGSPVVQHLPRFAPIRFGNNVSICAHATILQGVEIGDFTVIGAGAVVARNIPPHSLAVGMPARVVKQL